MGSTDWNEVGDRFTQLGDALRSRWADAREQTGSAEHAAEDEVRDAVDGVRSSLDAFADAITRTVHDEQVHGAARTAASGLIDALGTSLGDLADKVRPPDRPDGDGPTT